MNRRPASAGTTPTVPRVRHARPRVHEDAVDVTPRILFTTEGTYPSVMGGVSTWCDQLIRGLSDQEFHVLQVVGPLPATAVYELPSNVTALNTVHLWRPRTDVRRPRRRMDRVGFELGLENLLRFAHDDLDGFARGLRMLARLGAHVDLWAAFEHPAAWRLVAENLSDLTDEAPSLAEVTLAVNWLRATLAPLLYVPPEVDQAHTTSNGLSAIPAWLASREHGVPLMLTEHGLYLRERYLGLSSEQNPPALKLLRARFYRALARLMYRDADLVVSVSEFNRAWQIRLGAPVERTRVVYNGVAPTDFPVAADAAANEPTVGWVGRVDPIKDLETLVRAFVHVADASPRARLRLFGPVPKGNERYHRRVVDLISDLRLGDNVTFEGPVRPVHQAYHAADVVALSSVSEGFPYVAIEAMMCGRPVVATRVGGVGEAVGTYGRMVEPRDPLRLGNALTELLLDAPLRRGLGAGARERALSLFTLARMHDGYRSLYGELAGRPTNVALAGSAA